jgi:hypothetical protein
MAYALVFHFEKSRIILSVSVRQSKRFGELLSSFDIHESSKATGRDVAIFFLL